MVSTANGRQRIISQYTGIAKYDCNLGSSYSG